VKSLNLPKELRAALWPHQREAIEFAWSRLQASSPKRTNLVRMPTGTGKTGVIAVLCVVDPPTGWSLILTPWKHLCDQMIDDLSERFWESRGWKPSPKPKVLRLFPKTLDTVLGEQSQSLILVATFATLVGIFKNQRPRYDELAKKLGQVFVDEGHYEPAAEWGQAVKYLEKPTLLLTATPYRNDLKLFRVEKENVFNFTHRDAVERKIIRNVDFQSLQVPEPKKSVGSWCRAFVKYWKSSERRELLEDGRAIVCCSSKTTVEAVTRLLRTYNLNALGIHERFVRRRVKWLKRQTPDPRREKFSIWVHQNKLTEGLDDSRFCIVAILNRIQNDRKLIQQVGRVLRTSPRKTGRAMVLHSEGLPVRQSWKNYLEFEVQPNLVDPERYRSVLTELIRKQPDMEYFGRRFRKKFNPSSGELSSQILLRATCVVRELGAKFRWDEFVEFTTDFLLLEDCILLGPTRGPLSGPSNSRLWVYMVFGNTPLLIEHSQYEMRLGAMGIVRHGDLLFLVDTEGMYPAEYLSKYTKKLSPNELGKILSKSGTTPKQVSIVNPWPAGPTVRSSTLHADDLSETPAQLSDAVFVCRNVRANVKDTDQIRRHYLGFQRGRLSEELASLDKALFSLREFVGWTRELSQRIKAANREVPEFFNRYLSPIAAPAIVSPKFLILNMFGCDLTSETENGEPVEFMDSIVEVEPIDANAAAPTRFSCTFRYKFLQDVDRPPEEKTVVLLYDANGARFRIKETGLQSEVLIKEDGKGEGTGFETSLNNNDDLFTVALTDPMVFYTAQAFYRIDYAHAEERLASVLTRWPALSVVDSEKGEVGAQKKTWDNGSIFNLIESNKKTGLMATNFGRRDFLFCDDLETEAADFVCADFARRKIAFIHAKQGSDHVVSASALHIVVAQALKNLSLISRGGSEPMHLNRWNRNSYWSGTQIRRWRAGRSSLPVGEHLWEKLRLEILDHPLAEREVWLVLGRTLQKDVLLEQLKKPELRDAVTGQTVHLLSSLHANCIQLGVHLRVFCN
jgi:superfamily II DNA or RNA helicase